MSRFRPTGRILTTLVTGAIIALLGCSPLALASETDTLHYMMPNVTVVGDRNLLGDGDDEAKRLVKVLYHTHMNQQDQLKTKLSYRKVDRTTLSLANFNLKSRFLNLLFPSFYKYVKTSGLDGKWVLPLSQRESVSDVGYMPSARKRTEIIRYKSLVGLDQNLDDGTISIGLNELFPDIDLYESNIKMFDAQFAGPLSENGFNQYKYYLTDTIVSQGYVQKVISFYPYVPNAFTLRGDLYVTAGDDPRLLKTVITVPKKTGLNFIDELRITQEFSQVQDSIWLKSHERMAASLRMYAKILSAHVDQERTYTDFNFNPTDSLLFDKKTTILDHSEKPEAKVIGSQMKQNKLLVSDSGIKQFLEELKTRPVYRFGFELADMIALDRFRTWYNPNLLYGGSTFDIGPISAMFGQNETEGIRIRLGGETTSFFSKRVFLDGYIAYGFKDRRLKYSARGTYSFRDKRYFKEEFPRHEISIMRTDDIFTPGQIFFNNDKDNLLYNLGTSYMASRSYRQTWRVEYLRDYLHGFSFKLIGQHQIDTPTGNLSYIKVQRDLSLVKVDNVTDFSVGAELRWAPGEVITEGSMQRQSAFRNRIQREVPVFFFRHETGMLGLGGDYVRNRTELQIDHRLWMGTAGRVDYRLNTGKIWNSVPFPMLYTPPVNYAIMLNDNAFQLLNPYEYLADEWINLFAQWHMRGLLFNLIPFVKNLGLRGVVSVGYLYGNTTKKNQQQYSKELFVLPNIATEMINMNYAEVGFGIENIIRFLRFDVFYRVTPPGPNAKPSPWAFRAKVGVSF